MLAEIQIVDLGIIEHVDVVLGDGMTAITGETGAGKTMLVEAISLLMGARAAGAVVRHGASEARVEGRFVHDDREVVVRRVIPAHGRSRAYIDGALASLASLEELTRGWLDLHGQHAYHGLGHVGAQREALDRWVGTDLGPLRAAREHLAEIDRGLDALGGDDRARAHEMDLLTFQLAELEAAQLGDPDEDEHLRVEYDTLAAAADVREIGARRVEALGGDGGVTDLLGAIIEDLGAHPGFGAVRERLQGLQSEAAEVTRELRSIAEGAQEDPERLDEIRTRRQLLHDLRRKYGDTLAEVIEFRERGARRLAELEGHSAARERLDAQRTAAVEQMRAAAAAVGDTRRRGAGRLASALQARLVRLGMPQAAVRVDVGDDDPGDDVVIMFSANRGMPVQPLARVASGGELSRAMLALRLELSAAPDTLVFDEVDAGVGGRAAHHVADALCELAQRHQVIVVTHLAQVAARAQDHLVVSKATSAEVTTSQVGRATGDARVGEVARLLSGHDTGAAARRHAEDLLGTSDAATSPTRAAGERGARRAAAPR